MHSKIIDFDRTARGKKFQLQMKGFKSAAVCLKNLCIKIKNYDEKPPDNSN